MFYHPVHTNQKIAFGLSLRELRNFYYVTKVLPGFTAQFKNFSLWGYILHVGALEVQQSKGSRVEIFHEKVKWGSTAYKLHLE